MISKRSDEAEAPARVAGSAISPVAPKHTTGILAAYPLNWRDASLASAYA
jgi:hypothetical protein